MDDRNNQLVGKVALLTGAASGIALATARLMGEAGAQVLLVDRDAGKLAEAEVALRSTGIKAAVRVCDLSDEGQVAALIDWSAAFPSIDILVNAAGIVGDSHGLLEEGPDDWPLVFQVNVRAPYLLIRGIGQRMVRDGTAGRIVNVTSSSAHRALWSVPAYGCSKAALMQLTRTAAWQLGRHDINVNAVAPGLTDTPMGTGNFAPGAAEAAIREGPLANLLGRISAPEDVAEAILFLCLPGSRQITGQTIHASAGAVIPTG